MLCVIAVAFSLELFRNLYQNQHPYYILALALIATLFLVSVFGFIRDFVLQVFAVSLCFIALFFVTALKYKSILYVDMYLLQGTFLASMVVSYRYILGAWLVILPTILFLLRDEKIYPGEYFSDVSMHVSGLSFGLFVCSILFRQMQERDHNIDKLKDNLGDLMKVHKNAYKSFIDIESDADRMSIKMRLFAFSISSQLNEIMSCVNEGKSNDKQSNLTVEKAKNLIAAASALGEKKVYASMQVTKMSLGNILKFFNESHNSCGSATFFRYESTDDLAVEVFLPTNVIDILIHHLRNHLTEKYKPGTVMISVQLGQETETLQNIKVKAILCANHFILDDVDRFNRMMKSSDYFYGDENHAQMIKYCLRRIRGYSHVSFERHEVKFEISFWVDKVLH